MSKKKLLTPLSSLLLLRRTLTSTPHFSIPHLQSRTNFSPNIEKLRPLFPLPGFDFPGKSFISSQFGDKPNSPPLLELQRFRSNDAVSALPLLPVHPTHRLLSVIWTMQEKLRQWSNSFAEAFESRNFEEAVKAIRRMTYYDRVNEEIVKRL